MKSINNLVNELKNPNLSTPIITELKNLSDKYLEFKETPIINDSIEILGDASTIYKFLKGANDIRIKRQLISFLKEFNPNDIPTEKQINKLILYANNEKKAQFISDTLAKILLSKSTKSCSIMGFLLNNLIENKETLSHKHIICADALVSLFDHDIDNFNFICKYMNNEIPEQKSRKNKSKYISYYNNDFRKLLVTNNIDNDSMQLTIEKLSSIQILFKEIDVSSNVDFNSESVDTETDEYYKISSVGELLYQYIKILAL